MLVYCRVPDMGCVYAFEWLGGMWRTKGSDFESLVYVSGLVFQTQKLNLTSDYHLETWRHLLSRSLKPENLPSHPQSLLDSSRLGATQLHLVPLISGPL